MPPKTLFIKRLDCPADESDEGEKFKIVGTYSEDSESQSCESQSVS